MQSRRKYGFPLGATILATALALLAPAPTAARAAPETPTDVDIQNAIEAEYLVDPIVNFTDVETAVSDGIVTLTGKVDHLRAKQRAVKIAGVVRGVRSVVDRLEVQPLDVRSDALVREDVKEALRLDPATDALDVEVAVQSGTVTLSGNVDSWPERRLATAIAAGVRGVTDVDDDQIVVPRIDRPDEEIKADIERALEWDVLVDAGLIEVSVQDGRVTLSGTAGSTGEKARAKVHAQIQGVESVDDSALHVHAWTRDENLRRHRFALRTDVEIRTAVESALLVDPRVTAFDLTAEVDEGVATLRGTVDNLKARYAAVGDARNTVGVLRVRDRIRVKTQPVADEDLGRRVEAALRRDPIVEVYEIDVDCENGVATLTGRVDSWYERSVADDVVSRVHGVAAIDNEIIVRDANTPLTWKPLVDDMLVHQLTWHRMHPAPVLVDQDQLLADVENQIFWSPFVSLEQVDVSVNGAIVTLTGEVDSWVERLAAAMNAYEAGATWVDNDIRIRRAAPEAVDDRPGP